MLQKKKVILALLCLIFSAFFILGIARVLGNNTQLVNADTSCEEDSACNRSCEPIVYATKKTRFTSDTFEVKYSVDDSIEILAVAFKNTGLNVVSYTIGSDNTINISLALENEDLRELTINIEAKDDINLTAKLFVIKNEFGIFVSPFSVYDAHENYFVYAKSLGAITEEECQAIRNELNRDSVLTETYVTFDSDSAHSTNLLGVSTLSDKDTYVKGTLQWQDDNGEIHPLREVMVTITCRWAGLTLISTNIYTDNNGYFSFTFQNKTIGYDVSAQVIAGDLNAYVKTSSDVAYIHDFGVTKKITTGSTKWCNATFTMNSDLGRAMQISQAVLAARDFAWEMSGNKPADVSVIYPTPINSEEPEEDPGCFYRRIEQTLYISGYRSSNSTGLESYASWDVIMH